MTDRVNDGGPAFPIASDLIGHCAGMTLRDYFAGQVIASVKAWHPADRKGRGPAEIAYLIADQMIEARKGPPQ